MKTDQITIRKVENGYIVTDGKIPMSDFREEKEYVFNSLLDHYNFLQEVFEKKSKNQ